MNYERIIPSRVKNVPPSGIRKFFDIVSEMKEAISLGVGEPDFVTPWSICEAAIYSLEQGETHYTSNWGTTALRKEIAQYMSGRFGLTYDPTCQIVATVGASEGIDLAMRALVEPGDEVLVPEPSYVSYMPGVVFAGGTPVTVKTDASIGFKITPEAVAAALTDKTKAFILPYPNNPTGGIMRRDDLQKIADLLKDTDVIVLSDEVYAELTYGGQPHVSFASLPGMWERTITLNGFSKAFAMTGWRMGFACAPTRLMEMMVKIHQFVIMCAPTMGQFAALEALRAGRENGYAEIKRMVDIYDQRRRIMLDAFRKMGLDCFEPLGAFYVFPSIKRTGLSSQEFCERLLYDQKVACVPGDAFGPSGEGHIRCCYATATDQIIEAMDRMAVFLGKLGVKAG